MAATLLGGALAHGEVAQQGGLRVAFNARFAPRALPRARSAPVRFKLTGSVATANGAPPPQLRRISIAVNRYGSLFTRGLPVCAASQLEQTPTRLARVR